MAHLLLLYTHHNNHNYSHSSPISVLQTVPSPLIQLNLHHSYGKYIFLLRLVSSMCYTLYLTGFFNTPIWRLICFPWFTVGFCVVDGFLQVSSFRWIHCFHDFILMNSPFKWSHVFLSLGLFSCWDRLDEFIVFVNSLHEFIFYMNPYISFNSICVLNEFITLSSFHLISMPTYLPHICGRKRCFEESFQIVTSVSALQETFVHGNS